jgi:hypothetical protein
MEKRNPSWNVLGRRGIMSVMTTAIAGDASHGRKHKKDVDGGKYNSHNTTWDVV